MKNIHNALSDVLEEYNGTLTGSVVEQQGNSRWRIQVRHVEVPNSLLEIEVLEIENEPVGCVLQRVEMSSRSVNRFLDRLMDALDLD